MPKKSAAHMNKVDEAVWILGITTGLNVPQAMILAGFSKKETTIETVRRKIRCHFEAHKAKKRTPRRDAPTVKVQIAANSSVISPLTDGDNDTGPTHPEPKGPTHPKPKRKQIRLTATTIQQRRINNLAAKRHKSVAHKAAVRLFNVKTRRQMACTSGKCAIPSWRSTKLVRAF